MCEKALRLIEHLSAEHRKVLDMAFFDGMTQSEIAARTGTPLGTIKTKIRSALSMMKKGVEPESLDLKHSHRLGRRGGMTLAEARLVNCSPGLMASL
jgi:Sigma-70, region 4